MNVTKTKEIIIPKEEMKYKFYLPNDDAGVRKMLQNLGHSYTFTRGEGNYFDIALFTGGADVHPFLYGEKVTEWCHLDFNRDLRDNAAYHSLDSQTPKVGICRGAQFLNVKSGGRMYQHVTNHTKTHVAVDAYTGEDFEVSSTHHQMMRPSEDAWVMLVADESSERYIPNHKYTPPNYDEDDIEAVYYHPTNSFCYQPHPEMYNLSHPCVTWFFDNIYNLYHNDIVKRRARHEELKAKRLAKGST